MAGGGGEGIPAPPSLYETLVSVTPLVLRRKLTRLANLASQMASEPRRDLVHRSCSCSLLSPISAIGMSSQYNIFHYGVMSLDVCIMT